MQTWASRSLRGIPMDKVSLSFFYGVGTHLGPLAGYDAAVATRGQIVISSLNVGNELRLLLDSFPALTVCRPKGEELYKATQAISEMTRNQTVGKWQEPPAFTEFQFYAVVNAAQRFQSVLFEELQGLSVYHPRQNGIYSTKWLVESAEFALPESIRAKLDEKVLADVQESGRCLAFAVYTACGFHMMRAVEAVLHQYWVIVCKPAEPIPERLESWGEYIAKLREKDAEAKEVAAMIQQMKDLKRNNIMHPEMVLKQEEAHAMFVQGEAAIMAMAKRLAVPQPVVS